MKILHTSDWHLGHHLYAVSGEPEQALFLRWLAQQVIDEKADVLIIAGDIFDVSLPPKWAEKLYYEFLVQLPRRVSVVVIGGNHDSPQTLNAAKRMLETLNVHVRGGLESSYENHMIRLKDCVVCALPFVRESDLRKFQRGQSGLEREKWLRSAIRESYLELATIAATRHPKTPIIGVGHLATGSGKPSESERALSSGYSGDLLEQDMFQGFDYVALGHMHSEQTIGGMDHVRFSGSPYALSFGEARDSKQISCIEITEGNPPIIRSLPVPKWRKMFRLKGSLDQILQDTQALALEPKDYGLEHFLEVTLIGLANGPASIGQISQQAQKSGVKLLKIRKDEGNNLDIKPSKATTTHLVNLTPSHVFQKLCADKGITDLTIITRLTNAFQELELKYYEDSERNP